MGSDRRAGGGRGVWGATLALWCAVACFARGGDAWPWGQSSETAEATVEGPAEPAGVPAGVAITLVNLSPHDVDVYWDDGSYGMLVSTKVAPRGGSIQMNTFVGHTLYWTVHGRRQQVGEDVVIKPGQTRYELPADVSVDADPAACVDRSRRCAVDVRNGQCEQNPGWMIVHCPKSCNACHMLDPKVRCDRAAKHMNMSTTPSWKKGSLDATFERILTAPEFQEFKPKALSEPPNGPWVVTFENVVADDEIDALLSTVQNKFERSTDTGASNALGEAQKLVSTGRTSENAWCIHDCYAHPKVEQLTRRIESITGVPQENYENYQVLRYQPGQYYRAHHDMSPADNKLPCGPRILTFFLYLSDVEEGGGTNFPSLDLTVQPKKGSAVLWPSVLNGDPTRQDGRTRHAALAVEKGIKYAANAWIHLYDYKTPNLWGCTGSFS